MKIALISHSDCLLHEAGYSHPEQPARLRVIDQAITDAELIKNVQSYNASLATKDQLLRVHDAQYINEIFELSPQHGVIELDPDTFMNQYSLQAALRAAGANIQAVDLVLSGEARVAFCNVRPPGHHAERSKAMGFCIFNNVAVGAAHALHHHKLKRVAIIDFDVHHGNGTQDIFKNDERVLFCSSFQYPFFPFNGVDTQSDHIINIPLPAGATGREFRSEIEYRWLERISQFQPELIFFSAGFDGHYKDPISDLKLTESDYAWVTLQIKKIADQYCNGHMVSTLEGGYALDALGSCVVAHVNAMIGQS